LAVAQPQKEMDEEQMDEEQMDVEQIYAQMLERLENVGNEQSPLPVIEQILDEEQDPEYQARLSYWTPS
jgi:hypothetical protein